MNYHSVFVSLGIYWFGCLIGLGEILFSTSISQSTLLSSHTAKMQGKRLHST